MLDTFWVLDLIVNGETVMSWKAVRMEEEDTLTADMRLTARYVDAGTVAHEEHARYVVQRGRLIVIWHGARLVAIGDVDTCALKLGRDLLAFGFPAPAVAGAVASFKEQAQ